MECILTIDQGNTTVKYTLFTAHGKVLHSLRSQQPDLDKVATIGRNVEISGAVYASVAGLDLRFTESLRCLCHERLLVLTAATPVPIKNMYGTPATLGADRIAAAVGAATLLPHKPVLIADAGSALTLDLITSEAAFVGGTISPGIKMRLRALHSYTSRLPEVDWPRQIHNLADFPDSTDMALLAGAVVGTTAQIAHSLSKAREKYPDCRLLLTGGDAPYIINLPQIQQLQPMAQPELVAIGLNRIYHYNETNF